jgi:hypothetical protein
MYLINHRKEFSCRLKESYLISLSHSNTNAMSTSEFNDRSCEDRLLKKWQGITIRRISHTDS